MTMRSTRERVFQSLCYELGGLVLATPLFVLFTGASAGESLGLIVALSLAVMTWAGLFNTGFDWIELRRTGRLASDRTWRMRVVHGALLELTSVLVTLPLIVWLTDLGWIEALVADLGLTLLYTAWAWVFHLAYDRWRPVKPRANPGKEART